MLRKLSILSMISLVCLNAQERDDSKQIMSQILQRLDTLEKQNRQLMDEIHSLKQELLAGGKQGAEPPVEDRVSVVEQRVAEQAQTKVESTQKFPLSIGGMLLFNAFENSRTGSEFLSAYGLLSGPDRAGATVGQSILKLSYQGPSLPGDGRVNGSVSFDFYGSYYQASGAGLFRIREANLSFDWKNRSFSVGQYKPLISPLQPSSLAEVGTPPLSGAGNLWYWVPQARYEERLRLGETNSFKLQLAALETSEEYAFLPSQYANYTDRARPALEGRFAFTHKFDESRKIEIAPGFHVSDSHVAGVSVPSRIASLDWNIAPLSKVQLSGTFYKGENVAPLGSLGSGFKISYDDTIKAVHTTAGWSQLSFPLTSRLTVNLFSGLEGDSDTVGPARDFVYASNVMYRFGPNILFGAEALQSRIRFASGSHLIVNHYDLALAYLF